MFDHSSLNVAPASVCDYRRLAYKRLPRQFFDYIDGGAYGEVTMLENSQVFQQLRLRQRVLRDVSSIDLSARVLGEDLTLPLILAPVGLAGCFARRGETQALIAANKAGVPFCLSTVGICSIEELKPLASASFWFQLYVLRDRAYSIELLQRAKEAGCTTLVFTVDLPVVGERYRDIRNGLAGSPPVAGKLRGLLDIVSHPRWLWDVAIKGGPLLFGNLTDAVPNAKTPHDFKQWVDSQFDPTVTWRDLDWIRENWDGKILIKGILDAEDAKKARDIGADGIVVSNHGGRQLDGVSPTLTALPRVADAISGDVEIIMDGGIRSGLDVFKALACGADACMIGRPWAYALAAKGEEGVSHIIDIVKSELSIAMALTGTTRIKDISENSLLN